MAGAEQAVASQREDSASRRETSNQLRHPRSASDGDGHRPTPTPEKTVPTVPDEVLCYQLPTRPMMVACQNWPPLLMVPLALKLPPEAVRRNSGLMVRLPAPEP